MKETILPVIKGRFQSFVKDSYPEFAKFMGDYFAWLEQDANFLQIINDWRSNTEPSNNIEPYITSILDDVGFNLNQDISVPKSTMLHFMKDFYLSRGSTQSFEFLFKILFADNVRIEYPRDKLLVPSYASYGEKTYVYLSAATLDTRSYLAVLQNLTSLSGTLEGLSSRVIVSVESITPILGGSKTYLEVEILKSVGDFIVGENVRLSVGTDQIVEVVQNVAQLQVTSAGYGYQINDQIRVSNAQISSNGFVSKIGAGGITQLSITSPGTGYSLGDLILARNTLSPDGSGFSAIVSSVGSNGELLAYSIMCPGYGFTVLPEITVNRKNTGTGFTDSVIVPLSSEIGSIQNITFLGANVDFDNNATASVVSSSGTGAVITLLPVSVFSRSDWDNNKGFIGENSTVIDSDKYQQYSYEVISSISPSRYLSIVDDMLHPAGYVRSAVIEIESSVLLGMPISTNYGSQITDIAFLADSLSDDIVTGDGTLIVLSVPDIDSLVTDIGDSIITNLGEVIELSR